MLRGRGRELAVLDTALADLGEGRGSVVLLAGEPGIGKTRLANEIASRAGQVRVAWGRCWEAGGAPAFWPWHEAMHALDMRVPDGGNIAISDPVQGRFALFREIAATLTHAASTSPLMIVLEDLHAADHSSVVLLEFLVTHLRTSPVLVVGTYRELEATLRPEIADGLARIGRGGHVLALARLQASDVAALVAELVVDPDPTLAAQVFEITQGNPLFVTEILQQVRSGAPVTQIPLGVREIIRQRLALVGPDARRVLEIGAVLGVEHAVADLVRLAPELDAALASGLLVRRGDRVRFVHSLYREALYLELPRTRRHVLHREAARMLATAAAPAELAHHLIESGPDAVPEAVEQTIVAARSCIEAFAFEDAIALLERAKAALPGGLHEATMRARLLIALGEARIRSGDPKGRELCVEGARIARELGDAALLALAGLAYGSVFLIGGVDPVMVSMLEDALAKLPPGDSGLRARTMARLASARQPSAPALRQRDIDLALEAVELARRVANRRELLEVFQSACGALYGSAHPRLRIQIARDLRQLAEEVGDAPRLIAAFVRIAMDYLELADFAGYALLVEEYERLGQRYGAAAGTWRIPLMRSMLALVRDDFTESARWQAVAATTDPDNPRAQRARTLHRICALRAEERLTELRAAVPELRSAWSAMPYGAMIADSRVASALARVGADDEVRSLVASFPVEMFEEEINLYSLTEALWCTADREQAKRLLAAAQRYADRWFAYWLDVEILEFPMQRSFAYLVGILGDWPQCEHHFANALRDLEALGRRSAIARMKFELGDLYVRCNHAPERARTLLTEARALAANVGLPELVALIDRRHGSIPVPRVARREFSLTREGEYYAIATERGTLRFKATRGFQYLATLVERSGDDVHVLELVGSLDADRGDAGELVDRSSLQAYRERAEVLRDVVEDAELRGDADRAEHARSELEALAAELSRGTRPGGKAKRAESAVDRARSAVQRRIKDAIDRIADADSELGTWLRKVVHTGNHCSFQGNV